MALDKDGNPATYERMINEYQRKLLHATMTAVLLRDDMRNHLRTLPGETYPTALDEAHALCDMLGQSMVGAEQLDPGVMHGLCL